MKNGKSSKIKKKYYHPKTSKEAAEKLKEFYLEARTVVPNCALRDYETLLWLAEDSARSRNSKEVTSEDARKAIDTWLKTKDGAKSAIRGGGEHAGVGEQDRKAEDAEA